MKLTNTAVSLAVGGLAAVGAGLMVARLLSRPRGDSSHAIAEPPPPEQLIGAPQARLSAIDAAAPFRADPDRHQ